MSAVTSGAGPVDNSSSFRSVLRTLPFRSTRISGGFWANYQQVNREVSLPHGFAMLEEAGNLRNLRIAAGLEQGEFAGYWFADSDVYKWLEAAAWELGRAPDGPLQAMVDQAIDLVQAAQQPDGYLDSHFQITAPEKKWTDLDHGHELYCAGHLIQAAVAFHRTLGDDRLLEVALPFVDHIDDLFGAGGRDETCGHPEIETALVELFRVTGDRRHLDLAQLFVDRRGRNTMRGLAGYGPVYQQDHVPVRQATEVAGHAVRQLYLTTGATDLVMERDEPELFDAMLALWADMVGRKLYVTGGVGSRFDGEAFGGPYELPSDTCYCETCAAIASLMWNWRLLLLTGQARYADLLERTLYNGLLSSPGLEGASYLYVNPLQVRGGRYVRASADTGTGEERMRPKWHNCACCPPNVMRILSSLGHYLATATEDGLQLHQFATAQLDHEVGGQPLAVAVETGYPWDGQVRLRVLESPAASWKLSLRVPAWSQGYAVSLNGQELDIPVDGNGYLVVERTWQRGDELLLTLPMEPAFVAPNPRIDALRGCVALARGPLVYCFESHDQAEGVDLLDAQVMTSEPPSAAHMDLLGGITALRVPGHSPAGTWGEQLYRPLEDVFPLDSRAVELVAVPYFAWGNRGMQSMRVWMPRGATP